MAQLTCTVTVRRTNQTTQEIVSLITDLDPIAASPGRLLELLRGRWSIENALHSVCNVTFGEDSSQLRSGHAPHVMEALRHFVMTRIHRQDGRTRLLSPGDILPTIHSALSRYFSQRDALSKHSLTLL